MLHYTYTATGQKISQQLEDEDKLGTRRDYAGPFVYVNQELGWVNTPHGRIYNLDLGNQGSQKEYILEFHLRDHLGNTRLVLEKHQDEYIPTQQAFYYPFGMAIAGLSQQLPENGQGRLFQNRYLYNGKEYQDDFGLNWYDYGARFYDPQIARWHSVDPLAENAYNQSPYNYAFNNPIYFIDPDGRFPGRPHHIQMGLAAKELSKTAYNALPDNTKRGVNATWNIVAGVGQFAGGVQFAAITYKSGVGPVFGVIVALDGSFRFVMGTMQLANVLSGGPASSDPNFTSILGDVFQSETLDQLSTILGIFGTVSPDMVFLLINLGASAEATINLYLQASDDEQPNANKPSNSENSSDNSDDQDEELTDDAIVNGFIRRMREIQKQIENQLNERD